MLSNTSLRFILFFIASLGALVVRAETFVLPPPDVDLVGQIRLVYAKHEDTLLDIARRYSLGYNEIVQANPGVDRWVPGEGTPVVLPTRHILPNAPRRGVVLNVPEMRLYFYPKPKPGESPVVITYPVSIGRMDWKTPLGNTKIIAKQKDPAWYPPASIKAEHAEQGDILPDVMPAGPDNPLGSYALRLGKEGYLIHGTNRPYGIGMRVTHGCVRMYPEDIERLFPLVPINTPVLIVNQHIKAGWLADTLFLQAHPPLEEEELSTDVIITEAMEALMVKAESYAAQIDPVTIRIVVEQASGLAVPVSL